MISVRIASAVLGRRLILARRGTVLGTWLCLRWLALVCVCSALCSPIALAQATFYWDVNGSAAGAGGASPNGVWSSTATNWSTSSAGTATTTAWTTPGAIAVFSAGSDATGNFTVTQVGIVSVGGLSHLSGNLTINGGGTLFLANQAKVYFDVLAGSMRIENEVSSGSANTLSKGGTGTLTLAGSTANLLGPVTVNQGTLAAAATAMFGGGGLITVESSGTLSLSGATGVNGPILLRGGTLSLQTAGSAYLNGNVTLDAAGTNIINIGADTTGIASGTIGGNAPLTLNGSGTLRLASAANFSTSNVTLSGNAVLELAHANSLSNNSQLIFNGGTLRYSAADTTDYSGLFGVASGGISIDTASQNITFASALAQTTGGFTKLGNGTLTLAASNGLTGTANLAGGTLMLGGNLSLGSTTVSFNGGTLSTSGDYTLSRNISSSTAALAIDTNGRSLVLTGSIDGTNSGNLVKSGSGTLTLSGNNSAFAQGVVVNAGTLAITNGNALGTGNSTVVNAGATLSVSNVATLNETITLNSGTLSLAAGNTTLSGNLSVNNAGTASYIDVASGSTLTTTGNLTRTVNLFKTGAGTLSLGGASTNPSGVAAWALSGGTLELGHASALGTTGQIFFTGGTLRYTSANAVDYSSRITASESAIAIDTNGRDVSFASALASTNTGGLTKLGAGNLTLSGNNSYLGATTLAGGNLIVSSANALSTGNLVFTGGTLRYNTAAAPDYSSRIATSTGAISLDTNGRDVTFASALDASNTGGLTKSGAGNLTLTAANNYTGTTTLAGGNLVLGAAGALSTGNLTFTGGALRYGSAGSITDLSGRIVNSTSAIAVDTGGQNITFANTLVATNTGGLIKSGTGTLSLTNASNAFSGNVTIGAGVLQVGTTAGVEGTTLGANSSSGTNLVTVSSGATLQLTANSRISNKEVHLSGTGASSLGALYVDVTGVTGNNTRLGTATGAVSPALVLDADATIRVDGTAIGSATNSTFLVGVTNLNGATLTKTGGGRLSFDSIGNGLLGTGNVVVAGGVLAFRGGAFNGNRNLTVNSGAEAWIVGDDNALSGNTNAVVVNGVLNLNARGSGTLGSDTTSGSHTLGALSGNGTITSGTFGNTGTQHLTVGHATANSTFSGTITQANGVVALTKAGTGTLTLAGNNSYTGGTTLRAGTLAVGHAGALGSTGNLSFTGGVLQYSAANTADYSARIANSTSAIAVDTNGQNVAFASALAASNTGGLTKSGAGNLTLAAASSYTGTTTLAGGNLVYSGTGSLGTGNLTFTGGSLVLGANGTDTDFSSRIVNSTGAISLDTGGFNLTFANALSGTNTGGLAKLGTGTLTLSGNNSALTGEVNVAGGTLAVAHGNALGTGGNTTLSAGGTLRLSGISTLAESLVLNGGTLALASGNASVTSATTANAGTNSIISVGSGSTLSLAGVSGSSTSGTIAKEGDGTLTFSSPNTYLGTWLINAGVFELGAAPVIGNSTVTFGGGTIRSTSANSRDYSARIANSTSAMKIDTNGQDISFTSVLAASNTGGLTKLGNGTLSLSAVNLFTGDITLAGGTLEAAVNGSLSSGNLIFTGGGFRYGASVTAADYSARIRNSTGAIDIDTNSRNATFASALAATNTGGFIKRGTGDLTLSGANAYAGDTQILGGRLVAGASGVLPDSTNVSISGGATLALAGFNEKIGSLSGAGNVELGSGRLETSTTANTTYTGQISGSGGLTKSGSGTLTLGGANTYTGNTTITGGKVVLAAANVIADTSAVTLASGTELQIAANETLASINGSGTLTLSTGANLTLLDSSAVGLLHVTGNSVLDFAPGNFSVSNFVIDPGVYLTVTNQFIADNWWTNFAQTTLVNFNTNGSAPYNQVTITSAFGYTNQDTGWQYGTDLVAPVPEPSTYGALLLGGLGAWFGWRRWRAKRS